MVGDPDDGGSPCEDYEAGTEGVEWGDPHSPETSYLQNFSQCLTSTKLSSNRLETVFKYPFYVSCNLYCEQN